MYVSKKKKEFKHFECWEIVKYHPTFQVTEPSTPPTYRSTFEESPPVSEVPDTIDLDETQRTPPTQATPQSNFGSSSSPVRPIGVKKAKEAKRKGKQVASSSNEARDDALNKIHESQQSWIDFQKSRLENVGLLEEKVYKLRALEEETKIMTMNMEAMTPNSKRYFTKRKAEILNRIDDNGEEEDATFANCYRPLNFSD